MAGKPVFVATHPRACSTAFEMVFMTRRDILTCVHEPFGDAFYYGPERLSDRYEKDVQSRHDSSFSKSTYKTVMERLENDEAEGKRLLLKDITYYLSPPDGKPATIAPSLAQVKRGVGTGDNSDQPAKEPPYPYDTEAEAGNPTVVPTELLKKFHFTFLIRHPKRAIPSYYKCTVPPQDKITGFYDFMPSEAGYDELRRLFDYLRSIGEIGPHVAGQKTTTNGTGVTNGTGAMNGTGPTNGTGAMNGTGATNGIVGKGVEICVVDADDLLDKPGLVIEAFCKSVGIDYNDNMLKWDTEEELEHAKEAFAKWPGFHDDALTHKELKPRDLKKECKSPEEEDAAWRKAFGEKGAKVIRETVDKNMADYEYLKKFAIKI